MLCSCVLQVCLSVLHDDNQANGLLAMRLIVDLNKQVVRSQAQVASYEQQVNEVLNFIHKVRAYHDSSNGSKSDSGGSSSNGSSGSST